MYRVHTIECKLVDRKKADEIIDRYVENHTICNLNVNVQWNHSCRTITYWLGLVVSDDLEIIKNEFREAGIELF